LRLIVPSPDNFSADALGWGCSRKNFRANYFAILLVKVFGKKLDRLGQIWLDLGKIETKFGQKVIWAKSKSCMDPQTHSIFYGYGK